MFSPSSPLLLPGAARRFLSTAATALTAVTAGLVLVAGTGCGNPERRFDAERAFAHLEAQVAVGPRVPGHPGHARGLDLLRRHLEGTADRVSLHRFHEVSPLDSTEPSRNI